MASTGTTVRQKAEPKPWYEANMGPLPAGISAVNHNLGLTNPDEIVVQFWDSGGIEPLVAEIRRLETRLAAIERHAESTAKATNGEGRAPILVETA